MRGVVSTRGRGLRGRPLPKVERVMLKSYPLSTGFAARKEEAADGREQRAPRAEFHKVQLRLGERAWRELDPLWGVAWGHRGWHRAWHRGQLGYYLCYLF